MIVWNEEQRELLAGLASWCEALSAEHIERDADAAFPWDKWKLVQECGILRLPFDEAWGGLGQNLPTTMYLLEGLGRGCRDGGLNFAVSTHLVSVGIPLQRYGSAALKEKYMPAICSGDPVGAHAITEPDSGSDALRMRTFARRDGDEYVLDGSKTFVSNGPVAGLFVVYARTHPDGGALGTTAFLVERDTPGFSTGQPIAKMGLRTSPLCELYFDGCRVPATNVIGRPGGGFLVLDHVMKWEILCSFAINLGEMQHRLQQCVDYAKGRVQFGRTIGNYQAVSHKIADMKVGLETTRKWLYDTALKLTAGENVTVDLAITKLVASEENLASALAAVQIHGGNGYMAEYGVEKDLRNAVAGTIYSGTSEIQRNRVSAMLGLGGGS
ncbi:acyl-CoA dehydrogenase family protein [Actinocrispum wychmicini]|uniref:Alkylation response protein AidB-like acyl-CoA dehydrogenase n=1 Tax=Actinocrispum wychmicini TaxID=1213861 RepID=A0A4V2S7N0_9PSEU|nr:acyl-CoA dehydrogenase family protein [Actinocrispum wychmicini]TCO60580.1 alkylation response protein AidB-like acyl-CoA dehydrogenase [Actinocrispum wychmicini]